MWILLVEDDAELAESLETGLKLAGYEVDIARDGQTAETMAMTDRYDLLIVDWVLPRQDGRMLISRLRAARIDRPILMLTALADLEHRVRGLDSGADDYLTKPFSFDELFARLRALARRNHEWNPDGVLEAGPLQIDLRRHLASIYGHALELRSKEFAILRTLAYRPNTVTTRTSLAEQVWGSAFDVSDDAINTTISSLRNKLTGVRATGSGSAILETVRGVGYRLAVYPESAS